MALVQIRETLPLDLQVAAMLVPKQEKPFCDGARFREPQPPSPKRRLLLLCPRVVGAVPQEPAPSTGSRCHGHLQRVCRQRLLELARG